MNSLNPYLKFVVAVFGAVMTTTLSGLAVYYGHTLWYPIVVSGVTAVAGAVAVYIAPNTPKIPKQ